MKHLVWLLLLMLFASAEAQTITRTRTLEPNATNAYDVGTSVKVYRNGTISNITTANATVNGTTTFTGPVLSGRTTANITSGTPLTLSMDTCASVLAITNITGGNVIINMVNVTAGQICTIVDESGKLGSTGNVTVNVTGGTINGFDNVTITNSSAISSGNPFDAWFFHAVNSTTGFIAR